MIKFKSLLMVVLFLLTLIVYSQKRITEKGIASYYSDNLRGYRTANGEYYNPDEMTAAHLTLPFDSKVEVINLNNHKVIIVRINDRGPFVEKRIIDLSRAAADSLDFIMNGLAHVKINVIQFGRGNTFNHQLLANKSKLKIKYLFFTENIIKSSTPLLFFFTKSYFYSSKIALAEQTNPFFNNISKDSNELLSIFHLPKIEMNNNEFNFIKSKPLFQQIMNNEGTNLWAFNLPQENIYENKNEVVTNPEKINKLYTFNNEDKTIHYLNINITPDVETKKEITNQANNSGLVYGVQIGSFKIKSNMLDLSEKLKKDYIDKVNIQEVNKNNIHFYRLMLGEFTSKEDAEKLKDKIKDEYPKCFINSFYIK